MQLPDEFFSTESVLVFSSATAIVWVTVNAIRYFFGFYRRWLFLIISALVMAAGFSMSGLPLELVQGFVSIVNTLLLALSAAGFNETMAKGLKATSSEDYGRARSKFVSSWFE